MNAENPDEQKQARGVVRMNTERERYMTNDEVDQFIAVLNDPLYKLGFQAGYRNGRQALHEQAAALDCCTHDNPLQTAHNQSREDC